MTKVTLIKENISPGLPYCSRGLVQIIMARGLADVVVEKELRVLCLDLKSAEGNCFNIVCGLSIVRRPSKPASTVTRFL